MDISMYVVGSKVRIDLTNNYFYQGIVLSVDKDSITIKDLKGQKVTLSINTISYIREVF